MMRLHFRASGFVFDGRGEKVATIFHGGPDSFSVMMAAKPAGYVAEWFWPYEYVGTFETLAEARGCILARHFGNG